MLKTRELGRSHWFSLDLHRFLVLCALSACLVDGAWYCKDSTCSLPVSEGRTTHAYNPSIDAVKNGYLVVEPHQPTKNFRISNDPFVMEVEVNGKRGLLPRSVVEVVEDYVGSAEYTFVDAPNAPREDDPYVENKTPEKEPDTVVQLRSSETNEVKAVEFATDDMRGVLDLSITSTVPEKAGGIAAVQVKSVDSTESGDIGVPAAKMTSASTVLEKSLTLEEKRIELPTDISGKVMNVDFVAPLAAGEKSPSSESSLNVAQERTMVPGGAVANTAAHALVTEKSLAPERVSLGATDTNPAKEVDELTLIPQQQVLDKNVLDLERQVRLAPPEATVISITPVPSEHIIVEKVQDVVSIQPSGEKLNDLTVKGALQQQEGSGVPVLPSVLEALVAGEVFLGATQSPSTDPLETTTIAPTASLKTSPAMAANSVVIEQSSVAVKIPEPKVTFQQADQFAGLPQYNLGKPPAVFTTKVFNRFHHHHDHGHEHGAHSHGHDHAAHFHAHHADGDHEHAHDHNHEDHSQDVTGHHHPAKVSSLLDSGAEKGGSGSSDLPVQNRVHDHVHNNFSRGREIELEHHHHDHSDELVERDKKAHVNLEAFSVDKEFVLAPNANITFVPPEDATRPPVDYSQLVIDRMEGRTVPGLLNEALDKEPSAGFPRPPPLDPTTATEAPRIPGQSADALPESDMHAAAINANPRYQRGERVGSVPSLSAGTADWRLHDHSKHSNNNNDGHDHSHAEGHIHQTTDTAVVSHETIIKEPSVEAPVAGSCAARDPSGLAFDVPCEDLSSPEGSQSLEFNDMETTTSESHSEKHMEMEKHAVGLQGYLQEGVLMLANGWLFLIIEFEAVSSSLRMIGMAVLAISTLVFMMVAASDRRIRRTMEQGFEEYDYKKESELLTLRDQIQNLLKQNQETTINKLPATPLLPPPSILTIPRVSEDPRGSCSECEALRSTVAHLKNTVGENEHVLKDHRDTHAHLLSKNNEFMSELRVVTKDRNDLKQELELMRQRLVDLEKSQFLQPSLGQNDGGHRDEEVRSIQQRLRLLEEDNSALRVANQQATYTVNETLNKNLTLQSERDEALSNVRLLKQLLTEKEEEIRKSRAAEAAGGSASARELQDKTDEVRSHRKQVARLQEELESMKRDRESQLQSRSQTFRIAADKAQRDAMMARQETLIVRQQLEELCRKYGEQVPVMMMPQMANGTVTPPGIIAAPPMMFPGMAYPPGPPPPTFEAFKQQVLSGGSSSGYTSPRSPNVEREYRREKGSSRKSAKDYSRNGKNAPYDDSDEEKSKNKDRKTGVMAQFR